jgi:hypothetical protein
MSKHTISLYSRLNNITALIRNTFGHPVKGCAFLQKGTLALLEGELAPDIIDRI